MKTTTSTIVTLGLATLAAAIPIAKRDDVYVEWTTEWETVVVTEYVDYTATSYATSGVPAVTTTQQAPVVTLTSTSTPVGGQFYEPTTTATPVAPTTTSSSSSSSSSTPVYVPPTTSTTPVEVPTTTSTTPVYTPPTTTSTTPVYTPPTTTTSTTPVYTPPTTTSAPVYTPPTTTSSAPAETTTASGGGGSGQKFTGDLTYYTVGPNACGTNDVGQDLTENIVAMNHVQMGELSNSNPMCGKTITIQAPDGSTTTAKITDKCMGCKYGDIDVSEKVFKAVLGSLDVGRGTVTWWFN